MQKTADLGSLGQRRIERAVDYVGDMWFPVNPELLVKLQGGIDAGVYDLQQDLLVSEIKADFSLFMYCLRELLAMLKSEGANIASVSNPIQFLRDAGLERLKRILAVDAKVISRHTLNGLDKHQAARLEEAMTSAAGAQVLAPTFELTPEIGYSTALIRQLGLTLIAWNYPTVYQEVAASVSEDRSFDIGIAERLGFSPTLLAIRMLKRWGLESAVVDALGPTGSLPEADEEAEIVGGITESLAELCLVSEALARANNPTQYPRAAQDWEFAKDAIVSRLGKDGVAVIQDALVDTFEHYLEFMPESFTPGLILDPDLKIAQTIREKAFFKNPYLTQCRPELKTKLMQLYFRLNPDSVREDNLGFMVREVVPQSGFAAGIVFTADPTIMKLVPQLRMNNSRLKKFEVVDYSLVASDSDSIAVAFRSKEPVIEYKTEEEREILVGISGVIGVSVRVGVLYLEISHQLFLEKEAEFLTHFKAISQAFSDCLSV